MRAGDGETKGGRDVRKGKRTASGWVHMARKSRNVAYVGALASHVERQNFDPSPERHHPLNFFSSGLKDATNNAIVVRTSSCSRSRFECRFVGQRAGYTWTSISYLIHTGLLLFIRELAQL